MGRVKQKEDVFYDLFDEFAAIVAASAETFVDLFEHYPAHPELIATMKEQEVQGDHQVSKIMTELNSSFITPFDRQDIGSIARELDEVIDSMEGVSARLDLFSVDEIPPSAIKMARLERDASRELQIMFDHFPDFKKDPLVTEHAIQVCDIEDRADLVYRSALGGLFDDGLDAVDIIKWKSLYDAMERALDSSKDVANLVLGVVMENA